MAQFAMINVNTYVGAVGVNTYANKAMLKFSAADLDATTFLGTHQVHLPGLKQIDYQLSGFWDSPLDVAAFANLGVANQAVTVVPEGLELKTAYLFQAGEFSYEEFGTIGEVTPFAISLSGTNAVGVIRGQQIAQNRSVSATGQLGSIATITGPTSTPLLSTSLH